MMTERLRSHWPALTIVAGLVLMAIGFAAHGMWRVLPWERFALSLVLGLLAMLLGWPLQRFARWSWAAALAAVWGLALVFFVGPVPVLAVAALAAAALAIGLRLVPETMPARLAIACTTGLVVIAGLTGWMLTWPVHHPVVWWPALLAIAAWQHARLRVAIADALAGWCSGVSASPRWAAFAVTLMGLASTACWLPTMQVDDLAYHLGLPSQLLLHARYTPDPVHQVWSMAPWAGDALHGISAVLAREHARGALNALWLALAAASVWSATTSLRALPTERWAAVALFASFPPLVWLAAGMQTELPAMAVLIALAAVIVPQGARRLYAGAVLLAGLAALKPFHLLSALPLVAYAGWHHRHQLPWRRLPVAIAVVLVVAGSSYWLSWYRTGNPVLPVFNAFFESPYFPLANYKDARWYTGFEPGLLWRMVFDTDRYVEAWDGGVGFTLIALSGAWLLALLRKPSRGVGVAVSLALLLPLMPMQYARYTYPGIALLSIVLLLRGEATLGRRAFTWIVAGVCIINLAFQSNAGWLHHSAALKRTILSGGDAAAVYPHYVPERVLLTQIPPGDTGNVLAVNRGRSYVAELAGRGRMVLDHAPALAALAQTAQTDASGAGWRAIFVASDARWVLVTPQTADPGLYAALQNAQAKRVSSVGDAELWQLPDAAMDSP